MQKIYWFILSTFLLSACAIKKEDSFVEVETVHLAPFVVQALEHLPEKQVQPDDYDDLSLQALSLVGRLDLAEERAVLKNPLMCEPINDEDLKNHISKAIGEHQYVFINEAHDKPFHRAFLADLLPMMREKGYSIFAAEAFNERIEITDDAYEEILMGSGSYINEPMFSFALKNALLHGFRLIAYEADFKFLSKIENENIRMQKREEIQIDTLMSKMISLNTEGKIIIFNGYGHASKAPMQNADGTEIYFMAGLLREKYGINPYSIDQTICSVEGRDSRLVEPPDPSLYANFDLFIGHPRNEYQNLRPLWMDQYLNLRFSIPQSKQPKEGWRIFETRKKDADLASVPYDRIAIRAGDDAIDIFVPDEPYVIHVYDWPTK